MASNRARRLDELQARDSVVNVVREVARNSAGKRCEPDDPDCVSIEVATVDDDGTETRTYLVRDAVAPVGWAVTVGELVAEGSGTTVVCNVASASDVGCVPQSDLDDLDGRVY